VTDVCNRQCAGCCNKDWDLDALPVCKDFTGYDEIMLTGGEPMLFPGKVAGVIREIRKVNTQAKVILYTAKLNKNIFTVLHLLQGLTVTLHEVGDLKPFFMFERLISSMCSVSVCLRLNVFKGIEAPYAPKWKIKDNIEWIKDCPLPKNEEFMRYE